MARTDRTLYRDTENQKLGGVCSGLGHYFDLDPLLVRVAFVAALVLSGVSFIAYLLLWWLMDPAPAGYWDAATTAETTAATTDGSSDDTTDGSTAAGDPAGEAA